MTKIVIPGELPTLNEYIRKERGNKFAAAKLKHGWTNYCATYCKAAQNRSQSGIWTAEQMDLYLHWFTKNKKKDKDNIRFAIKFIQDGMMAAGLIPNDGWQQIGDYHDTFSVDKRNPRVEIELRKHGE